jgi:hypothetical protein
MVVANSLQCKELDIFVPDKPNLPKNNEQETEAGYYKKRLTRLILSVSVCGFEIIPGSLAAGIQRLVTVTEIGKLYLGSGENEKVL